MAISDLHVAYVDNRELIEGLFPSSEQDWLIVAGDVGQTPAETEWALRLLSERFAQVIWAPGDHELWATRGACASGGEARYLSLVAACRRLGVLTPEDPYAVWPGPDGPVTLAPLFLLEEDTSRAEHAGSVEAELVETVHFGDVCAGGLTRHRGGCPCYAAWRTARVEVTERRLNACDPTLPTVLISHFPLMCELAGNLLDPKSAPPPRHRANLRLAPEIPGCRRRPRPPPHAVHGVAGRRAFRGGISRLPARLAAAGQRHHGAADHPSACWGAGVTWWRLAALGCLERLVLCGG